MRKRVIALGCFDGVHLGHCALLQAVKRLAKERDAIASAITFDVHPMVRVAGKSVPLLTNREERKRLMTDRGIEELLVLSFDEHLQTMPWQVFAETVLRDTYGAVGLVCGEDFRFGAGGEGTAELLKGWCEENRVDCTVVPKVSVDGVEVSSTEIRRRIAMGEMASAVRLLGHPFSLCGQVLHGNELGRTIGVPTANVAFAEDGIVPAFGVYAAEVLGRKALVNVGVHPTVKELAEPIAEAWIQDFEGDLYGQELRIDFLRRIRQERKFESLQALKQQLKEDLKEW